MTTPEKGASLEAISLTHNHTPFETYEIVYAIFKEGDDENPKETWSEMVLTPDLAFLKQYVQGVFSTQYPKYTGAKWDGESYESKPFEKKVLYATLSMIHSSAPTIDTVIFPKEDETRRCMPMDSLFAHDDVER